MLYSKFKKLANSNYFPIFIFLILSFVVCIFIMRSFLFSKGLIEAGDLNINCFMKAEKAKLLSLWENRFGFDYTIHSIERPSNFWFSLLDNSETAQRLRYLMLFTLTFFNFSVSAFYFLRYRFEKRASFIGAISCALIFIFNPWYISRIPHYHLLLGYSMTPLVFLFTHKAIFCGSLKSLINFALCASLFTAFSCGQHMIVFNSLFALIFASVGLLFNFNKYGLRPNLNRFFIFVIVFMVCLFLLSGYWLLPYLVFSAHGHSLEDFSFFRTQDAVSQNNPFFLVASLVPGRDWNAYIRDVLPFHLGPYYNVIRFVFLLFSALALSFSLKDEKCGKTIRFLFISAVLLGIFIVGARGILGKFYLWLIFSSPLFSSKGVLLRDTTKLLGFLAFFYSFLTSYLLALLFERSAKKGWNFRLLNNLTLKISARVIFTTILLIALFLNGWLLIREGYMGKTLALVNIPSQYQDLNNWLDLHVGDYKVAWLPYAATDAIWSPYNEFQGNLANLTFWASSKPVFGTANFSVAYPNTRMIEAYIAKGLELKNNSSVVELYRLTNTRFIIYRKDTHSPGSFNNILLNLEGSPNLKKVFDNDYFKVFEFYEYARLFNVYKRVNLVLGGLDVLGDLCKIQSFHSYKHPLVFIERNFADSDTLLEILAHAGNIYFYGKKDLDDLVLGIVSSKYSVFPAQMLKLSFPLNGWDKYIFDGHLWTASMLSRFSKGNVYDLTFDRSFLIANRNRISFGFPHRLKKSTSEYEVWARVLKSPESGELRFISKGYFDVRIDCYSAYLEGFKWVKLGLIPKGAGKIPCQIYNAYGWNVINAISFAPKSELLDLKNKIKNSILNGKIRTVNVANNFQAKEKRFLKELKNLAWSAGMGEASVSQNIVERSYVIKANTHSNGLFAVFSKDPALLSIKEADLLEFELKIEGIGNNFERMELKIWNKDNNCQTWPLEKPDNGSWQRYKIELYPVGDPKAPRVNLNEIDRVELLIGFREKMKFKLYIKDSLTLYDKKLNVPICINIAVPGSYVLAAKHVNEKPGDNNVKEINIDGSTITSINSKNGWDYYGPVKLKEGEHKIYYKLFVNSLIFAYLSGEGENIETIIKDDAEEVVEHSVSDNGTKYKLNVDGSGEGKILGFNEGFSDNWRIIDSNKRKFGKVFRLNLVNNGFILNNEGLAKNIGVYYLPQKFLYFGWTLTLSVLCLIVLILFF
jgi:hypothetical protein